MSGPKFRLVYKDKETEESYKVGNIWLAKFDGAEEKGVYSLQPVIEPNEQYKEMSFEDALEKYKAKDGFLNCYRNDPKEEEDDFE